MDKATPQKEINWPVFIFSIGLYGIAGYISAWLYFHDSNIEFAFYPGALFIGVSIIVFLLHRIKLDPVELFWFCLTSYMTYLAVYYVTLMTVWFVIFTGNITCGFGAILFYIITNTFIKKINFSRWIIFTLGAAGFLINTILTLTGAYDYFFDYEQGVDNGLAGSFFWWQILVGIHLVITLQKSK